MIFNKECKNHEKNKACTQTTSKGDNSRQTDGQTDGLPLMTIYQCIKFHLIPFYTFRDMLRKSFLLQKLRRAVTPLILVTELWFLHSAICFMALYQCIKFRLCIFNTFRDMLQTGLLLQKIRKGNNSVITCDRVTILAVCIFSDGCLSMYQVSFNSLLYFQRYGPDKLFIAKN